MTRPRALLIALVAWHLDWLSEAAATMIVAVGSLAAVGWVLWQGRW